MMQLSLGGGLTSTARAFVNAVNPFSTKSADFNGTSQFVNTNYQNSSRFQTSFSVSFWMKADDGQPAADSYIFSAFNTAASSFLGIYIDTNGFLNLKMFSNKTTETQRVDVAFGNGAQSDWVHTAITVDMSATAATTLIYLNGSVVDSTAVAEGASSRLGGFSIDQGCHIGCRIDANTSIDRFFNGGLDEFALFTAILDADSVAQIYNGGVPMDLETDDGDYDNSGNLELYYRFEDDLTDTTGTSNGSSSASPSFDADTPG